MQMTFGQHRAGCAAHMFSRLALLCLCPWTCLQSVSSRDCATSLCNIHCLCANAMLLYDMQQKEFYSLLQDLPGDNSSQLSIAGLTLNVIQLQQDV